MKAEHTAGATRAATIIMGDDEYIFTTYGRKSLEGLAALIDTQTAAPDLLQACRIALKNLNQLIDSKRLWTCSDQLTYELVEAAIAKAEGSQQ